MASATRAPVIDPAPTVVSVPWVIGGAGVEFKARAAPLDPYFLGVWLGDGTSSVPSVTAADEEVVSFLEEFAAANAMNEAQRSG
jgi:hypothetical protein